MTKVEFTDVMNLLLSENKEEAEAQLHEWFVQKSREILEGFEPKEELEETTLVEDGEDEVEADEEAADEVEADEADEDGEEEAAEATDEEEAAEVEDEAEEEAAEEETTDERVEELDDKIEDLESQIAMLKAEFDKVIGISIDDLEGEEGEEGFEDEFAEFEGEGEAEETAVQDELEGDEIVVDDEDFKNLEESFKLKPVAIATGEQEVGDGEKINTSVKTPLPAKKTTKRSETATAIEIEADADKGFDLEKAPAVKPVDLSEKPANAKEEPKKLPKGGATGALLNTTTKAKETKPALSSKLRGDKIKG